jgi:hypothetical protein
VLRFLARSPAVCGLAVVVGANVVLKVDPDVPGCRQLQPMLGHAGELQACIGRVSGLGAVHGRCRLATACCVPPGVNTYAKGGTSQHRHIHAGWLS